MFINKSNEKPSENFEDNILIKYIVISYIQNIKSSPEVVSNCGGTETSKLRTASPLTDAM